MKKRIIWKVFLLEIVTLGIYRLYWLIKTRKEMMEADKNIKIKSPWFFLAPVLVVLVSLIFMIFGLISTAGTRIDCKTSSPALTTESTSFSSQDVDCKTNDEGTVLWLVSTMVFYIGLFVAFILYVVWLWGYCQGVEVITKEKLNFGIALVILILVPDGIDILIIQDGFNKVGSVSPTPPVTPVAQAN